MRAELRAIHPNNYDDWEAFVAADMLDPWNQFDWFDLSIGPEGDAGTNYFQVLVSTPSAVSRAKGNSKRFRGVLVDSFEPDVIAQTLRNYVGSLRGTTWEDLVNQLRQTLHWEYEGMGPG